MLAIFMVQVSFRLRLDCSRSDGADARQFYGRHFETYFGGTCTVSTGHGFSALSRKKLLHILQERCRELGIRQEFEREVTSLDEFATVASSSSSASPARSKTS